MTLIRILAFTATAAVVALVGLAGYGWINGVRFYAVESGSMAPAIHQGDLVIDLPKTATTTYSIGDIITFHPTPGYTTTHRIVALDIAGISTRGDANTTPDIGVIPPSSVVGRMLAIVPFGGYAAAFFRQPAGIAALLLVITAVYLAWHFSAGKKSADSGSSETPPQAPDTTGGGPG